MDLADRLHLPVISDTPVAMYENYPRPFCSIQGFIPRSSYSLVVHAQDPYFSPTITEPLPVVPASSQPLSDPTSTQSFTRAPLQSGSSEELPSGSLDHATSSSSSQTNLPLLANLHLSDSLVNPPDTEPPVVSSLTLPLFLNPDPNFFPSFEDILTECDAWLSHIMTQSAPLSVAGKIAEGEPRFLINNVQSSSNKDGEALRVSHLISSSSSVSPIGLATSKPNRSTGTAALPTVEPIPTSSVQLPPAPLPTSAAPSSSRNARMSVRPAPSPVTISVSSGSESEMLRLTVSEANPVQWVVKPSDEGWHPTVLSGGPLPA